MAILRLQNSYLEYMRIVHGRYDRCQIEVVEAPIKKRLPGTKGEVSVEEHSARRGEDEHNVTKEVCPAPAGNQQSMVMILSRTR